MCSKVKALAESTGQPLDKGLPIVATSFNRFAQVEARTDDLSADTGAVVLRETVERSGTWRGWASV